MACSKFVIFPCLILIISCGQANNEIFQPTNSWKPVRKGQKLPQGLHIRTNLQTGLTEAKLLDEETTPRNQALSTTTDELLKPDQIKQIKQKYRTFKELKKELNEVSLTPKIDAEIMSKLLADYKLTDRLDRRLQFLEELDFLAHQIDNGWEFVRQGGFEVMYSSLNSSNLQIKLASLKLFSSLVQNNDKVQIYALGSGMVGVLLKLLNLEDDLSVKSRVVTSISCFLRRFPEAQLSFIKQGGLEQLNKLFQSDFSLKVQVKLASLLSDLIIEGAESTLKSYRVIRESLVKFNWCENLNKLLMGLMIVDPEDHDSIEKVLWALNVLKQPCVNRSLILRLTNVYENLLKENSNDKDFELNDYFMNLVELCKEILQNVPKDEL